MNYSTHSFQKLLLSLMTLFFITSCYRMPEPDEYSLVPSTNNRLFTKEKTGSTPELGY